MTLMILTGILAIFFFIFLNNLKLYFFRRKRNLRLKNCTPSQGSEVDSSGQTFPNTPALLAPSLRQLAETSRVLGWISICNKIFFEKLGVLVDRSPYQSICTCNTHVNIHISRNMSLFSLCN